MLPPRALHDELCMCPTQLQAISLEVQKLQLHAQNARMRAVSVAMTQWIPPLTHASDMLFLAGFQPYFAPTISDTLPSSQGVMELPSFIQLPVTLAGQEGINTTHQPHVIHNLAHRTAQHDPKFAKFTKFFTVGSLCYTILTKKGLKGHAPKANIVPKTANPPKNRYCPQNRYYLLEAYI